MVKKLKMKLHFRNGQQDELRINSKVKIQIAGGEGIGYEFRIKVTKSRRKNGPLKGAKFK